MMAHNRIGPTLSAELASRRLWDLLVVGAGPAGSLAAHEAARRGLSVLLIDKSSFPRSKVCGGCLNRATLDLLNSIGLGNCPVSLGGKSFDRMVLLCSGRRAFLPLPSGIAVSRERLDAILVQKAIVAGAVFCPETHALVDNSSRERRFLTLSNGSDHYRVEGKVVVAADGLGGSCLRGEKFRIETIHSSRVGAGTVIDAFPDFYEEGTIFMACGSGGYVGLVRIGEGQLDVAASFDTRFLKQSSGPGSAACEILESACMPVIPELSTACWRGTPALTRRRVSVAAERLFVIGDAAGYVEPFTGEGIGWALASAEAVIPFVIQAVPRWNSSVAVQWEKFYREKIIHRQRLCKMIAWVLRQPSLVRLGIEILSRVPRISQPAIAGINSPLTTGEIL